MTGFDFTSEISCKVCLDHPFLVWRARSRASTPILTDMAHHCAGQSLHLFARRSGAAHGSPPDIREHFDDPGYGTLRAAQVSLAT
jgi:hypothetical protein